jgi:hypothetical protein
LREQNFFLASLGDCIGLTQIFACSYVLASGSGILGVAVALNALSDHATCTVWFAFVGMVLVALAASVRKLEKIAWLTWVGFASIVVAVFIVV